MAAINISTGFHVGAPVAIDDRLILSKLEMKEMDLTLMPDIYFAICKDDNKLYIYNKNNEVNEETGKFVKSMLDPSEISTLTEEDVLRLIGYKETIHIVTAEESADPNSPYYKYEVGSGVKVQATGVYKYIDDGVRNINQQTTVSSYVTAEQNAGGDDFTVVVSNVEVLRPSKDPEVNVDWYNKDEQSFTLTNVSELRGLSQLVNEGTDFTNKTIELSGDIDGHGEAIQSIGLPKAATTTSGNWYQIKAEDWGDKVFSGHFNGNGHTIKNLKVFQEADSEDSRNNSCVGFFGIVMPGSIIENINFENVSIDAGERAFVGTVAGLVAAPSGTEDVITTFRNINVTGLINITGNINVGGILGRIESNAHSKLVMDNCHVNGTSPELSKIQSTYENSFTGVGGLIGCQYVASGDVSNCSVKNITIYSGSQAVGGLFGHYEGGKLTDNTLENVVVVNEVTREDYQLERVSTGLIAGTYVSNAANKVSIVTFNSIDSKVIIPDDFDPIKGNYKGTYAVDANGFPTWDRWPLFGTPRSETKAGSSGWESKISPVSGVAYTNTKAIKGSAIKEVA